MRWKSIIWNPPEPNPLPPRRAVRWTLAALLALAIASVSGCHSIGFPPRSFLPPLRIGTVEQAPPLAFRQKARWQGLEVDLGRALAKRLEMTPVFIAFPPDQLPAALLSGKVDILMAGIVVTEERRVQMDFSTPFLVVGQAALIRSSDLFRFNTDIRIRSSDARAGVIAESAGDALVSRYFPNAVRVPLESPESGADALLRGDIDLFLHDAPAAWWIAQRHPETLAVAPPLFAKGEIAWAFRRGSVALRESANHALEAWQQDGTLESILRRWIPVSK